MTSPTPPLAEMRAGVLQRWRDALTPARCKAIFTFITLATLFGHVLYLHHSPIDLSGDEAHYWDWSRQLDYGYYSKGPLVAWIIRASCFIFGNTMPAVRYPALALAAMSSTVTYALTKRLFQSDRLALGATALFLLTPLFVAGSLLMTIDPPFFFCWAAATFCFSAAALEGRAWGWPAAGALIGVGFLAKFGALLWLVGAFLFLIVGARRRLKSIGPWLMLAIALAFTTPTLLWNARHDWVSFRHVARQVGLSPATSPGEEDEDVRSDSPSAGTAATGMLEYVAGQVGVIGPGLAVLIGGAAVYVCSSEGRRDARRPALQLLLSVGGTFWVITWLDNLRGKTQINWPAPAYFTLIILASYWIGLILRDERRWKIWRNWIYVMVLFGVVMLPITHRFDLLYPIFNAMNQRLHKPILVSKLDPTTKLRGWHELGERLGRELATMPANSFILCDDYQQTAETAFYTPGQPKTYCAGSYFSDPKRRTQYDLWNDRRLDPTSPLLGLDAIYVGKAGGCPAEVRQAFTRVVPLAAVDVVVDGEKLRSFRPWQCTDFKGMNRVSDHATY